MLSRLFLVIRRLPLVSVRNISATPVSRAALSRTSGILSRLKENPHLQRAIAYKEQVKANNQKNNGAWVTPYQAMKMVFISGIGFLAEDYYRTRQEILREIEQLYGEVVSLDLEVARLVDESDWLNQSIPRASLYLDIKKGVEEKKIARNKFREILLQLEQIEDKPILCQKERVFLGVQTKQIKSLIAKVEERAQFIKIFSLANEVFLLHQTRCFDKAETVSNEMISVFGDYVAKFGGGLKKEELESLKRLGSRIFNVRGLIHRRNDNYINSLRDYSISIRLCPANDAAYHNRGFLLEARADGSEAALYAAAFDNMQKANSYEPHKAIYLAGMARVCHQAALRGHRDDQKSLVSCHFQIKECEESLGNSVILLSRAKLYYDRALDLEPRNPIILSNRGELLAEMGELEGAKKDFEGSMLLRPNHEDAPYFLGYILAQQGRFEEAKHQFSQAKKNLVDFELSVRLLTALEEQCDQKNRNLFNIKVASTFKEKFNPHEIYLALFEREDSKENTFNPKEIEEHRVLPFGNITFMSDKEEYRAILSQLKSASNDGHDKERGCLKKPCKDPDALWEGLNSEERAILSSLGCAVARNDDKQIEYSVVKKEPSETATVITSSSLHQPASDQDAVKQAGGAVPTLMRSSDGEETSGQ